MLNNFEINVFNDRFDSRFTGWFHRAGSKGNGDVGLDSVNMAFKT